MTTVDPSAPVVRPDALLARAGRPGPAAPSMRPTITVRLARRLVTAALDRMFRDRLTIVEDGEAVTFGPGPERPAPGPGTAAGRRDKGARSRRHRHGLSGDAVAGAPVEREPGDGGLLEAWIEIDDPRAWTAVATEGSVGLGRGFIEGWWTSPDPVSVVRVLARNLDPVDDVRNRIATAVQPVTDRVRRLLPAPSKDRNRDDIASHYDLGNDFFSLFLDDTMTYSSGVFASPLTSMADASAAKNDRLLDKLGLHADHDLLEIGTGWGAMALHAGRRGASVTTTTISHEQFVEAERRVRSAEEDGSLAPRRVELLETDWRDLAGRYDRIVSVEMIEAVHWRDYRRFFATIERCLAADGMVAIQAICLPDRRWARAKNTEDFIRRFVFPGGYLPSIGAITEAVASTRLQLLDVEDLSRHYVETLRRWRIRFEERLDDVRALGLDDRFVRLWRFYLAYCEAAFDERSCTVNQFVFVGPDWRPGGLGLRPC